MFITWDAGNTSYLENLYIPLFAEIQKKKGYQFHVIQFTWAEKDVIQLRKEKAQSLGIELKMVSFTNTILSKFKIILKSRHILKSFIKQNSINYVMPRSYIPGLICLCSNIQFPLIYDADGLAYLEKKETGKSFLQLQFIRFIEWAIIKKSNLILTRTEYAINWYKEQYKSLQHKKFKVVPNGTDARIFFFSSELRAGMRKNLGLSENQSLFIYIGSIGAKYGLNQTLDYFDQFNSCYPGSRLLILSHFLEEINNMIPGKLKTHIDLLHVPHNDVNAYLNAADAGFCLLHPTESMKAVHPVKINEYLLAGLPVITNKFFSDLNFLKTNLNSLILSIEPNSTTDWVQNAHDLINNSDRKAISEDAMKNISLKCASNVYFCALKSIKK